MVRLKHFPMTRSIYCCLFTTCRIHQPISGGCRTTQVGYIYRLVTVCVWAGKKVLTYSIHFILLPFHINQYGECSVKNEGKTVISIHLCVVTDHVLGESTADHACPHTTSYGSLGGCSFIMTSPISTFSTMTTIPVHHHSSAMG